MKNSFWERTLVTVLSSHCICEPDIYLVMNSVNNYFWSTYRIMDTVQQEKREKNTLGRRRRLSQGQEERKHRGRKELQAVGVAGV